MAIQRVSINDFLVFTGDFSADFCPGVNVLIGGNGTGKTTLLRAMYAIQVRSGNLNFISHIANYFRGPFLQGEADNIYNSLKKLLLIHSDGSMYGFMRQSEENRLIDSSNEDGRTRFIYKGEFYNNENNGSFNSVFIPEKDLLSNSKKLPESVEYGELQFTRCEIDLIKKARVAAIKPLQPLVKNIYNIIGGSVSNDGEEFFVRRDGIETPIPFSMEASGYRKFGLLATLIRNEQIKPGTIIFWDEPENSLNPELVPILVDILLEITQNGVQIFIATHDYNLARYFDVRKDKNIPVMFHNLTKTDGGGIVCASSSEYIKIPDNLFESSSADLFKAVVTDAMEVGTDE
jgi:AAA15 family ATPase/GTPase